ncbi:MAG: trypsin-like peptidase domain-containing protein [Nanoarchaeota archaeon]
MALQKHHKIIIGGVSTLVILFMITSSVFMYMIFIKQSADYDILNKKINAVDTDAQTKFNELSNNLLETKSNVQTLGLQLGSLDTQLGSLDKELTNLKASASSDFSGIIESVIKSVVTIKTNIAQGSGFIIANGGYVVTNAHVMEGATAAQITTYDGKNHQVTKIGEDTTMDIILLKISDTSYNPLDLGNSNDVQIGEKVIAIGNPLGLQFSVSEGIVSAVHRQGENQLNVYIQTDASLNSGNSGGPLIDTNGRVVGLNNFKISGGESLGFALESNSIRSTINDIAKQSSIGASLI